MKRLFGEYNNRQYRISDKIHYIQPFDFRNEFLHIRKPNLRGL